MKTFNATQHNEEIVNSRVGGFGGADAKLFLKIGERGLSALSTTDKKRIAIAKGLTPYTPIAPTEAMLRGHRFEDYVAEVISEDFTDYADKVQREFKIQKDLARNFNIFAHADFYYDNVVCECKCTSVSWGQTAIDYEAQLQWYFMLGATTVYLCHSFQEDEDFEFLTSQEIERNEEMINTMLKGVKLLDENWDNLGELVAWSSADLLPHEQQELINLKSIVKRIEALENEADNYKKRILQMMKENGIYQISTDDVVISYVAPTTRKVFDRKKFEREVKEIDLANFEKESHISDSIRIKIK